MKNILSTLTALTLAAGLAHATSASVATVPTGMITYTLPHSATTFLSMPLAKNAVYTSSITAVTATTITVGDAPAPFTSNLASASAPYFVRILSGAEMGRVLLITANTTSALTLETTDNSNQTVTLTASGFAVAAGDTFEIIPAATLASTFGDNSAQNPLTVNASTSLFTADTVGLFSPTTGRWKPYFFNSTAGYWEMVGSSVNMNNAIIYPNSAVSVTRRSTTSDGALVVTGQVTPVPALIKTTGNSAVTFTSTGYASDITLSQLNFGSGWTKGDNALQASTVSLWNPNSNRFDTYFQKADQTWRLVTDATTDQSDTVVEGGMAISVLQRAQVSGSSSFLATALPYSL